jgi:hypothetical protein
MVRIGSRLEVLVLLEERLAGQKASGGGNHLEKSDC